MSKKLHGLAKKIVMYSTLGLALASGACTDKQTKRLDINKVRQLTEHVEDLDKYHDQAKSINEGVIDTDTRWEQLKQQYEHIQTYESLLEEGGVDVDKDTVQASSYLLNKLDRFRNKLLQTKDVLEKTKHNKHGKITTFTEYTNVVVSLREEYDTIAKSITAFSNAGFKLIELEKNILDVMNLMEDVAYDLANAEEQNTQNGINRKNSKEAYQTLSYLVSKIHN